MSYIWATNPNIFYFKIGTAPDVFYYESVYGTATYLPVYPNMGGSFGPGGPGFQLLGPVPGLAGLDWAADPADVDCHFTIHMPMSEVPPNGIVYDGGLTTDPADPFYITLQLNAGTRQVLVTFIANFPWDGANPVNAVMHNWRISMPFSHSIKPPPLPAETFVSGPQFELTAVRHDKRREAAEYALLGQRIDVTLAPHMGWVDRAVLCTGDELVIEVEGGQRIAKRLRETFTLRSIPGTTPSGANGYLSWDTEGSGWDEGKWGA